MSTLTPTLIRWLCWLALLGLLGAGRGPSGATEAWPETPLSALTVAATVPAGWAAVEGRVRRGVSRGAASFRFGVADREDVIAVAMERAWRAFGVAERPIEEPEAWGRTIAVRVGLDALRRRRRERQRAAVVIDTDPLERHAARLPGPFDVAAEAERRALLLRRIGTWPSVEQQLALLLVDGRAETVTEAAWLYRAEEEARGEPGTMYPHRARVLLDARRRELEDLA